MQTCAENGLPRFPEEDPFELEFKSKNFAQGMEYYKQKKKYMKRQRDEKVRERSRAKKWL